MYVVAIYTQINLTILHFAMAMITIHNGYDNHTQNIRVCMWNLFLSWKL